MKIQLHKNQPPSRSVKKRELYKLLVARSDITASLNSCKQLLEMVDGLGHKLYYPLFTAVVICYARPFTKNKPFGSLPEKWYKFNDAMLKEIHEDLLKARHELIAHSDMTVKEAYIIPPGYEMGKDGEKSIVSEFVAVQTTTEYFPRPMFEKAHKLCMFQGSRLNEEIDKLVTELYGNMELPNAPFKIKIHDGL